MNMNMNMDMNKCRRVIAAAMAFSIMLPLTACGSDNSSSTAEQTESVSSADALKKVYDTLLANDSYNEFKSSYTSTTFEEKLENDSIVITAKGTEGLDGTFTFPVKDGYLTAEITGEDYTMPMLFTMLTNCVGEAYGIDGTLFSGWLNGMGTLGIESKYYKTDKKSDGSGTMQIYIAEKPDMKELDEMYIGEKVLENYEDTTTNFSNKIGKIFAYATSGSSIGTLSLAIGEYGGNTELTLKSIKSIVEKFKPTGYEEFLDKFTELAESSSDKFKVTKNIDDTDYGDVELPEGYSYYYVIFGN